MIERHTVQLFDGKCLRVRRCNLTKGHDRNYADALMLRYWSSDDKNEHGNKLVLDEVKKFDEILKNEWHDMDTYLSPSWVNSRVREAVGMPMSDASTHYAKYVTVMILCVINRLADIIQSQWNTVKDNPLMQSLKPKDNDEFLKQLSVSGIHGVTVRHHINLTQYEKEIEENERYWNDRMDNY